jgi:hypothetical protein
MKWQPLAIQFALSLKYASSAGNKHVTKPGFVSCAIRKVTNQWHPAAFHSADKESSVRQSIDEAKLSMR